MDFVLPDIRGGYLALDNSVQPALFNDILLHKARTTNFLGHLPTKDFVDRGRLSPLHTKVRTWIDASNAYRR